MAKIASHAGRRTGKPGSNGGMDARAGTHAGRCSRWPSATGYQKALAVEFKDSSDHPGWVYDSDPD